MCCKDLLLNLLLLPNQRKADQTILYTYCSSDYRRNRLMRHFSGMADESFGPPGPLCVSRALPEQM
jgi:hypothetical protein